MSNLIRITHQSLDRPGDQTISGRRLPKPIQRQVDIAHGRGLVAGARITGAAYATRRALVEVALLSHEEEELIQFAPLAEGRMKAIVDSFALIAACEVANLGK